MLTYYWTLGSINADAKHIKRVCRFDLNVEPKRQINLRLALQRIACNYNNDDEYCYSRIEYNDKGVISFFTTASEGQRLLSDQIQYFGDHCQNSEWARNVHDQLKIQQRKLDLMVLNFSM